ncbi:MAG: isochorismatase family protein [Gemmatimonadota bacterium]|nr:isochorismatase family protein [Gemmatimonadota bacterium]
MSDSSRLVGWVVDVQNDFMRPTSEGGRLYVSDLTDPTDAGAINSQATIERAVTWMRACCDVVVFTTDWHGPEDAEIDAVAPDPAAGTYPPHCMGRSDDPGLAEGAEILESVRPDDPLILDLDADATAERVARLAVTARRPVVIRKNRFDVFTGNSATEAFVGALAERLGGNPRFVVIGVSRDVCVTKAVDGLLDRGYRTIALRDATWGLGLEAEAETLDRWRQRGEVATLDELVGVITDEA